MNCPERNRQNMFLYDFSKFLRKAFFFDSAPSENQHKQLQHIVYNKGSSIVFNCRFYCVCVCVCVWVCAFVCVCVRVCICVIQMQMLVTINQNSTAFIISFAIFRVHQPKNRQTACQMTGKMQLDFTKFVIYIRIKRTSLLNALVQSLESSCL